MVTHDLSEAISMSDRVLVLSKRPARVLKNYNITFNGEHRSPLKSRESPEFTIYFNDIWKELNSND